MEIRQVTIRDYDEIVKLWSKAGLSFKPKGRDSREAIAREIKSNRDFFIGAYDRKQLVGIAVLSSDRRKGWINRLAIDSDRRKLGIAKALIKEAERIFRNRGLKIFCALIEEDNIPSRSLFKTCEYVEHHDILYFSKRDSNEV